MTPKEAALRLREWYQAFKNFGKGNEPTVKELLEIADLIEELDKQVPRWISVEEHLPDHEVRVQFGYDRMQYVDQGYLDHEDMCWYDTNDNRVARPSHCMPLPEPPKEE